VVDGGRSTGCFYKVVDSEHDPERSTWKLGVFERAFGNLVGALNTAPGEACRREKLHSGAIGKDATDVPLRTLLWFLRALIGLFDAGCASFFR
jgi:hypothetical protein